MCGQLGFGIRQTTKFQTLKPWISRWKIPKPRMHVHLTSNSVDDWVRQTAECWNNTSDLETPSNEVQLHGWLVWRSPASSWIRHFFLPQVFFFNSIRSDNLPNTRSASLYMFSRFYCWKQVWILSSDEKSKHMIPLIMILDAGGGVSGGIAVSEMAHPRTHRRTGS